jgi:hypothetical protein
MTATFYDCDSTFFIQSGVCAPLISGFQGCKGIKVLQSESIYCMRESLYGLLFESDSASVKAIKSEFIALANSQSRKIYLGFQLDPVALFFVCAWLNLPNN